MYVGTGVLDGPSGKFDLDGRIFPHFAEKCFDFGASSPKIKKRTVEDAGPYMHRRYEAKRSFTYRLFCFFSKEWRERIGFFPLFTGKWVLSQQEMLDKTKTPCYNP